MTRARRDTGIWRLSVPEPVGDPATLLARLEAMAGHGSVALGVDLPLGLPRAYAERHASGWSDFPAFLRGLRNSPAFFQVASELAEVSAERPFYPARGTAGMTRAAHAIALGLSGARDLCRNCDRATAERPAGAPLFWTLGANQSGKAAISAWRDFVMPALIGPAAPALWPFQGALLTLLDRHRVVIAETYPAEAMRHLGLRMGGSKRRQADRAALAAPLLAAAAALSVVPDDAMVAHAKDGFGGDTAGEDRFDSVLGVLCVLGVLAGRRPDGVPGGDPAILRWEGWVLGQTALPRPWS